MSSNNNNDVDRQAVKSNAMDALRGMKFMKRKEEAKRIEMLRTTAAVSTLGVSSGNNATSQQQQSNNNNSQQQRQQDSSSSVSQQLSSVNTSNKPRVLSLADLQKLRLAGTVDHTKARRNFSIEDELNNNTSSSTNEEVERLDANVLQESSALDDLVADDGNNDEFGNSAAEDYELEQQQQGQKNNGSNKTKITGRRRERNNNNNNDDGDEDTDSAYPNQRRTELEELEATEEEDAGAFGLI